MKNRQIPIIILLGIIMIGFIRQIYVICAILSRRYFTKRFRDCFIEMANDYMAKGILSNDLYLKCIHDVDEIQKELGNDGILAEFIDPLNGIQVHNYQLFVNIIPELRSAEGLTDNFFIAKRISQSIGVCDDALQRHIGNLDFRLKDCRKRLFNPFRCFGEGIGLLLGLPMDILSWCGLIRSNKVSEIRGGWIFRIIKVIVALIGLIGSVITIILGWDEAIGFVMQILRLY